jgi:hypothetical protein
MTFLRISTRSGSNISPLLGDPYSIEEVGNIGVRDYPTKLIVNHCARVYPVNFVGRKKEHSPSLAITAWQMSKGVNAI